MSFVKLFGESWERSLRPFLTSPEFNQLGNALNDLRKKVIVYPEKELIFKAFTDTPYDKVKVVLVGNINNRCIGSSYAYNLTPIEASIPLDTINLFKKLESDLNVLVIDPDSSFKSWKDQGVLFLNTSLTIGETSHNDLWKPFIYAVCQALENKGDIIYMFPTGLKEDLINFDLFLNSEKSTFIQREDCFSTVNSVLYMREEKEIDWSINNNS